MMELKTKNDITIHHHLPTRLVGESLNFIFKFDPYKLKNGIDQFQSSFLVKIFIALTRHINDTNLS